MTTFENGHRELAHEVRPDPLREPIAVIGMGCRFPGGANNPTAFWELLRQGVDTVKEIPLDRWNSGALYDPDPTVPGKMIVRHASLVDNVGDFDPQFFNISPREAISMDPQGRLLLEVAWEALEHAGLDPTRLHKTQTGVFVGTDQNDYAQLQLNAGDVDRITGYDGIGTLFSFFAGRLSYALGVRGASISVDTACSSSNVAIHLASQSLRLGESDIAVVGAVHLVLSPQMTISLSKIQALSPEGRSRTFDANANGYGRGEGCAVVVLKRLSDAQRDGDHILALIRGSAVNHDGPSDGLMVPSQDAQEALLRQVLRNAGVSAPDIDYVEAHGTGTPVGDPIELRALANVMGCERPVDRPLIVGSVKTNIGHLEAAAGLAGLIKVILAFQHEHIPPHLHFETPNPRVDWDALPITIPTTGRAWPRGARPRLAGVSSSGLSGTNAYIIVQEPPPAPRIANENERSRHILALSAKTSPALVALADRYAEFITTQPAVPLADICYTAAVGRAHFDQRAAFVASSADQLQRQLRAFATSTPPPHTASTRRIAFLFTGQGAQYVNMGRELYLTQPTFRRIIEQCSAILADELPEPLVDILYPPDQSEAALAAADARLAETRFTQPALFAVEYALATLWQSWGVTPDVVMGHSVGEYVAACIAGVFSLQDGLRLVAARGRLMQALPDGGTMMALRTDEATTRSAIHATGVGDAVAVAAINGPENVVISGAASDVATVATHLAATGIKVRPLNVSHAFHSALMQPMLSDFVAVASTVTYCAPSKRLISNVTGAVIDNRVANHGYWVDHVMESVRFADGVRALHALGCDTVLECGPRPTLISLAQHIVSDASVTWLPSLRLGHDAWHVLLSTLSRLYTRQVTIDWDGFDADYSRRKQHLPTYPFQRQHYWVQAEPVARRAAPGSIGTHHLPGQRIKLPFERDVHFQTTFTEAAPAYLADHKLYDTVIVPGASHVIHILQGAQAVLKTPRLTLNDVLFIEALPLDNGARATLQLTFSPTGSATHTAQIASTLDIEAENPTWRRHATAQLDVSEHAIPEPPSLREIKARCAKTQRWDEMEPTFRQAGYAYGPSFSRLDQLWIGAGEILGRIPPVDDPRLDAGLLLHPGVLDVCFQVAVADEMPSLLAQGGLFVPFSMSRMRFFASPVPGATLYCHSRKHAADPTQPGSRTVDLTLFQGDGQLIVEIEALSLRRASRSALLPDAQPDFAKWLYTVAWQPQLPPRRLPNLRPAQLWLLLADPNDVACQLSHLLETAGQAVWHVRPGDGFATDGDRTFWVAPNHPGDFEKLLSIAAESGRPLAGIINLWGATTLDLSTPDDDSHTLIAGEMQQTLAATLNLVHQTSDTIDGPSPRLWLVTRGAVDVVDSGARSGIQNVAQTALWGLGQVIGLELPELRCVRFDLDPEATAEAAAETLFTEIGLVAPVAEDQVAWRGDTRYVARLNAFSADNTDTLSVPDGPYELKITTRGTPANLYYAVVTRRPPEPHEVEIEVRATGQNFKDVLNALGLYQGDAGPFGGECAGVVTAIGRDVTGFAPGDPVLALVFGSYSRFVTVDARRVAHKPANLSFAEAATIPVTFLTAHYCLNQKAELAAGERILIHSAAGGVGLAAVQLAQLAGAEVLATASRSKWPFLRRIGLQHIYDSRSTTFVDAIEAAHGQQSVDVVLNALPDHYASANLHLLAPNGRWAEIGKQGIWSDDAIAAVRPDVAYHVVDLFETALAKPDLVTRMFDELLPHFAAGTLQPLPHTTYAADDVVHAFRAMQQGTHIGKFVITHNQADPGPDIRPNAVYLITGGLGGLGLAIASWLAEHGARHLVLTGRRGITTDRQQAAVEALRRDGVELLISRKDMSLAPAVTELMHEIDALPHPLRGVFHAAGVLDDGVLGQLSWPRFERVLAPKAQGAWLLHVLTQKHPLDHFVLFSSVASLLGSAGQANYAAGNAFLDGLAHYRRAVGLPGLSIAWGPWAEVGMAADQDVLTQWQQRGLGAIPVDTGLAALNHLLQIDAPALVGVVPVDWSRYATGATRPFLANCVVLDTDNAASDVSVPERLAAVPAGKREEMTQQLVQAEVARVLGFDSAAAVAVDESFNRLGMDSLTAVELRNQLQNVFDCQLSATIVFNYPTVRQMSEFLLQKLALGLALVADEPHAPPIDEASAMNDVVAALSADQIESALADELGEIEALLSGEDL